MPQHNSLKRQHTLWLMLSFVVLELVLATVFLALLVLPLARRAADDLAGLVVLSAQTWAELPPETRVPFANELRTNHQIEIRPGQIGGDAPPALYPPFVYLFERAVQRRLAQPTHLWREDTDGSTWYWVQVPVGEQTLALGWPDSRNDSRPFIALAVGLLAGLGLSWWGAGWLARRIMRPLSTLHQGMVAVGAGDTPALLPEDGPQELVALSQHFNVMARQVQTLLGARTTILAGVSHDLRTPLTRMRLALEMLRDHPTPALIDRLERDVDNMNRLISQVLELARGLQAEPVQPIDVATFFASLQEDFYDERTPIKTRFNVTILQAAPMALRRALSNLLQNAQRYAAGQPIELVLEQVPDGVRLGVLDRGPGIPVTELQRMQQPFQRLDASRNAATGGFGLGLAIVAELAKAQSWQFGLTPRPDGGLAAWLRLSQSS